METIYSYSNVIWLENFVFMIMPIRAYFLLIFKRQRIFNFLLKHKKLILGQEFERFENKDYSIQIIELEIETYEFNNAS